MLTVVAQAKPKTPTVNVNPDPRGLPGSPQLQGLIDDGEHRALLSPGSSGNTTRSGAHLMAAHP
jgi:hypothetical protein